MAMCECCNVPKLNVSEEVKALLLKMTHEQIDNFVRAMGTRNLHGEVVTPGMEAPSEDVLAYALLVHANVWVSRPIPDSKAMEYYKSLVAKGGKIGAVAQFCVDHPTL